MNYLKAIFWDNPRFTDPEVIHGYLLKQGNERIRRWMLRRFLEHGRVVDTLQFFDLAAIALELEHLSLKPYTYKKWKRIVEVYDPSKGR